MLAFLSGKMNNKDKRGGNGYIILNIIRVFNIIALLTIIAASWVMLVMTVKTSSFFFFDGVSHFVTNAIGIFLVISEINLFKSYFAKWWPLLSNDSGFVPLGLAMVILGFNILGHLNKEATSVENLGLPLWRIVIASGIITSIMGVVNLIATYVFCDSQLGITGRMVRSKGATTTKETSSGKTWSVSSGSFRGAPSSELPIYKSHISAPSMHEEESRFNRFTQKFTNFRKSYISRPQPQQEDSETMSKLSERSSPLMPHIRRPPTALHPAMNGGVTRPAYAASSVYSVATNVTGFPRHNVI